MHTRGPHIRLLGVCGVPKMATKRTRSTGDDLAEDWWVDEGEHGSSNTPTARKKMKETVGEDDRGSVLPQKKKKKKKTTMEKIVQKDKVSSDQWIAFATCTLDLLMHAYKPETAC